MPGDSHQTVPMPLLIGLSVSEVGEADLLVLRMDCVTRVEDGSMVDRQLHVAMSRIGMKALGEALIRSSQAPETADLDLLSSLHGSRPN